MTRPGSRFDIERSAFVAFLCLLPVAAALILGWMLYSGILFQDFRNADFDIFHAVGQVAWETRLIEAYQLWRTDLPDLAARQVTEETFLFTYPPQLGIVFFPLGGLDRPTAYLVFMGVSLALYLFVLSRLAGDRFPVLILAAFPIVAASVLNGQTSLLVAGLAGLYLQAEVSGRRGSGVPLGLMIVKPHVAAGFAVEAVLRARWHVVAGALAAILLSTLVATLAFGADVWRPFLEATTAAGDRLTERGFMLDRMTSAYALATTIGLSSGVAFAIHGVGLMLVLAWMLRLCRSRASDRITLGVACIATLAVSPYVFEYDLAILFLGLALMWGDLVARSSLVERLGLVLICWAMSFSIYAGVILPEGSGLWAFDGVALQAAAFWVGVGLIAVLLRRPPRAVPGEFA